MEFWQRRTRRFKTKPVRTRLIGELNQSQAGISGFDLGAYQSGHVVLIGAGGIGSHVGEALVRKGIGRLSIIDDDRVELKNLTRQLFERDDVGELKAIALARGLARRGLFKTKVVAHPRRFQVLLGRGWVPPCDAILIGGVDNNRSRLAVARTARAHGLPAIHAAVSRDGAALYVMVQQPEQACWACAFPHMLNDATAPCGLPGIIDVLQVVAGLIVFSVDSLLSGRHRNWNVREVRLDGDMPDRIALVPLKPDCPLCVAARAADAQVVEAAAE